MSHKKTQKWIEIRILTIGPQESQRHGSYHTHTPNDIDFVPIRIHIHGHLFPERNSRNFRQLVNLFHEKHNLPDPNKVLQIRRFPVENCSVLKVVNYSLFLEKKILNMFKQVF